MGVITTVEDQLITATQTEFSGTLKTTKTVPGPITMDVLKAMVASAPAVYWSFLGGRRDKQHDEPRIDGRFVAYIISRNARGATARRRGGPVEIGIYEIIERLVPLINDMTVTDIGTFGLQDVQNLFSIQLERKLGAALWAATFSLPDLYFSNAIDISSLDDFITFGADYDIPTHEPSGEHEQWLQDPPVYADSQPDAQDEVTLEQ